MEHYGKELNANQKLALSTTGMEGTGEHFTINGESAEALLHQEKVSKFNNAVEEYVNKFEKHNQALEQYAKDLSDDLEGLEIMPMFGYVLIKPFDQNPFQQIKRTESGLITDLGGMTPQYKSNETGQIEEEERFIKVGTVIETGHKCEFLKPGDVVIYTVASEIPVPFYKMGFVVVNENRVMAVVNEKLTERRNEYRNGR